MNIDREYVVLQTKYRMIFNNKQNIFPDEWYNIQEYDLKKKILKECIENNILIINSSYYYKLKLIALSC